jgi:hypothetical protein
MRKRTALIASLALLAALLTAFTFASMRGAEPTYGGHSLSYWLEAESVDTKHAVRAIGSNAIPLLVGWIS